LQVAYGITANKSDYMVGREEGLKQYCQLDNAFATGLNGQTYYYVCPQSINAAFKRYHAAAYDVYEDRSAIDSVDNELSSKESKLQDKKLTDKDRQRIRSDIRDLDRKRDRLRDDLYDHERQLDQLRRETQFNR